MGKIDTKARLHKGNKASMTYYILKSRTFSNATAASERVLYLLKRRNIPEDEQRDVINLNCLSVQRIDRISDLLNYLSVNTADAHHQSQPYVLKKISWSTALEIFGLDEDTDSSESA
jgi:hypothetical protein